MAPNPMDGRLPGFPEGVRWLHRLTRLPVSLPEPDGRHYAAMKLGVHDSARYYAERLTPLALSLIRAWPETTNWVLTAPPLHNIPAGANLVCRHLFAGLTALLPGSARLTRVDLLGEDNARDHGRNYSAMTLEERMRSRRREPAPVIPTQNFAGRAVLFVNDICVTGTQERFMRRHLAPAGPAAVYWLYLVHVDEALGRRHPELEHALNRSSYASYEAFSELLAETDFQCTGKCLRRLFSCDPDRFERLLGRLDAGKIVRIAELALREGPLECPDYAAKLSLLTSGAGKSLVSQDTATC